MREWKQTWNREVRTPKCNLQFLFFLRALKFFSWSTQDCPSNQLRLFAYPFHCLYGHISDKKYATASDCSGDYTSDRRTPPYQIAQVIEPEIGSEYFCRNSCEFSSFSTGNRDSDFIAPHVQVMV
jgi:hypothetical protein